jgi:polynucleotide 5'-kinase involved in rRNA processing
MDHSFANLIEFTTEPMKSTKIESSFTHEVKGDTFEKSEKLMHNKEQGEMAKYYNKLEKEIEKYTEVFLFGPTDAKKELFALLKTNHSLDDIKIELAGADKMTENQQFAFVRNHFSEHQRLN